MDKKAFYIAAGILGVLIVILVVTFTFLNSRNRQPVQNNIGNNTLTPAFSNNQLEEDISNIAPQAEPTQTTGSSPEKTAGSFFEWYYKTNDPLGSGAYKTNPDVSEYFKETLQGFVARKDHLTGDPVFACVGTSRIKSLLVQPAVYNENRLEASVILDEMAGAGASYKVVLSNVSDKWVIDDIRCNF